MSNELDKNLEVRKILNDILDDLCHELNMYKSPGGYQDPDYYIKCDAKVDAFEEAINIVNKHKININI